MQVRKEELQDIEEVFRVNTLAFDREDEAKLVNNLRKNSNTFIPELSLVATTDQGDIVGVYSLCQDQD
jgi:putative acetyltransferase